MASRKHHRHSHSESSTQTPFAGLPVEQQGGPVSLEESAALSGSSKMEETMDTHEATGAMRETAGKVEKNYGRLKEKATDAIENATDQAGVNREQVEGTVREMAGRAQRVYGTVKSKVSQAAEDLSDNYQEAGEAASQQWNRAMTLVQDNPGTAIGVSLLVGAGLGAVIAYLSRRD